MAELTREALYALVWQEPMVAVAARYDVSSSYLARVCERLNVPRPERGYWAKLAVGNAPQKPPLPEAGPGHELTWSKDGVPRLGPRPLPRPPKILAPNRPLPMAGGVHPLLRGVKEHFEAGRLSWDVGYLKPAKRLIPDLVVSNSGLDKAISFANQLFQALEARGYRVLIAPATEQLRRQDVDEREDTRKSHHHQDLWSPGRCTVTYIGTVAFGMTVIEMSEEVAVRYVGGKYIREDKYVPPKRGRYTADSGWTTKKDFPTGRLCLQAYSPYSGTTWLHQWRESKTLTLVDRIAAIVKELERAATEVARQAEEAVAQAERERQRWAAAHEKWQREEEERRKAKAYNESKQALLRLIDEWAEAKRIEDFFMQVEKYAGQLPDAEREQLQQRAQRGRTMAATSEALQCFMRWKLPEEH